MRLASIADLADAALLSLNLAQLFDNLPEIVGMTCYLRVSATFTPDQDGPWEFGLGSITGGDVYLDGKLVVSTHQAPQGEMFFGGGTTEEVRASSASRFSPRHRV